MLAKFLHVDTLRLYPRRGYKLGGLLDTNMMPTLILLLDT